MRNHGPPMRMPESEKGGQSVPPEVGLGYGDVVKNLGYRPAYQTWRMDQQRNYEVGRMIAFEIKGSGREPPSWPRPDRLPRLVHQAWFDAGAPQFEPMPVAPIDETIEARALFTRRGVPLPVPEGVK